MSAAGKARSHRAWRERVAYVNAVDPAEEAFGDARRYAAEHEINNVEFWVGSVYGPDFPDDHFDACLCHSALETFDRPLDALIEMKRILSP